MMWLILPTLTGLIIIGMLFMMYLLISQGFSYQRCPVCNSKLISNGNNLIFCRECKLFMTITDGLKLITGDLDLLYVTPWQKVDNYTSTKYNLHKYIASIDGDVPEGIFKETTADYYFYTEEKVISNIGTFKRFWRIGHGSIHKRKR